jgi:hypothetical protein
MKLAGHNRLQMIRVLEHTGIEGNEIAIGQELDVDIH